MSDLDPLDMARNCARTVNRVADTMTTADGYLQSLVNHSGANAVHTARLGASLATIAMAVDIRRIADALDQLARVDRRPPTSGRDAPGAE